MDSRRHAVARAAWAGLRCALLCGSGVAGVVGSGAQPASAQGFYREVYETRGVYAEEDDRIRPREVVEGLRDRGFSEIGRPGYDGRVYRVEATGPRGLRVRLLVDARDGAVIGREPVSEAYYPSARPGPVAPGYGWTEEDVQPRRLREAERIVPPADIPSVPVLRGEPLGAVREAGRGLRAERPAPAIRPDANPQGLNPDVATRSAMPRRVARTVSPPSPKLPSQARVAPSAPEPALRATTPSTGTMTPAAQSDTQEAKASQSPPALPRVEPERPASAKEGAPSPTKTASAASGKKGWQDPPPDGGRKNVRVIGGATVVPGESGSN